MTTISTPYFTLEVIEQLASGMWLVRDHYNGETIEITETELIRALQDEAECNQMNS